MKRWLPGMALACAALFGIAHAQNEKDAPSQKTRDAVQKFHEAPSVLGKNLEALTGALTGKSGAATPKAETPADPLTLPEKRAEAPAAAPYSPAGKRDPFQPLPLRAQTKRRPRENLSPLERYDLGQLKLAGIVWNAKEPRAMVEDSAGLGYVVKVGTPIGSNDGKIKEIKPTEVVVEETYVDFYGARKNRHVSMRLVSE